MISHLNYKIGSKIPKFRSHGSLTNHSFIHSFNAMSEQYKKLHLLSMDVMTIYLFCIKQCIGRYNKLIQINITWTKNRLRNSTN